jgi:hypothetical protein
MKRALIAIAGLILLACGSGEIPMPTDPVIDLEARYVGSRPRLDGRSDDAVWAEANPFYVHVEQGSGADRVEFNITFKAVWWKEWAMGSVDWDERAWLALLVSWPDDDKNIAKQQWTWRPDEKKWNRSQEQSDWMLIQWWNVTEYNDIWYWDAALTNPMGYAEDQKLLISQVTDTTTKVSLWIDGLNYNNDTADNQNTWDSNYNDNLTPRDSTDDGPLYAWAADVNLSPPTQPNVFSDPDERYDLLLRSDADFLTKTPYDSADQSVMVPGYVLESPKNDPADIMTAGRWENGNWTVELVRVAATGKANDVGFLPDDRYFSQLFFVAVGDNQKSPLEALGTGRMFISVHSARLNFQFIPPRVPR